MISNMVWLLDFGGSYKMKCIIPRVWDAPTHQAHCKVVKSKSYRESCWRKVVRGLGRSCAQSCSHGYHLGCLSWEAVVCMLKPKPGALEQDNIGLICLCHHSPADWFGACRMVRCQSWHWGTWISQLRVTTSFCQALIDPSSSPMMLPSTPPVRGPEAVVRPWRERYARLTQRSGPGIFGWSGEMLAESS